ncbi:MAG: ABC transporter substrate-binding protein [Acidimicrobiia bacterium]|nr:ABC transporter substrate-binding protein [Acidimicrobiia bacterium]MYG59953.1 ABC transporter substrate-binding protein [Acidimicrobiia bacterium]MYJ31129.1 ABC transporter substrate-binding protein [Acidimicrobiia bacterium]
MADLWRVSKQARWRWLALLCAVALVATACGGGNDDDDGSSVAAEATAAPESPSGDGDEAPAPSTDDGDEAQPSTDDGGDQGAAAPDDTADAPDADAPEAPEAAMEPQYGGTLVVGLEAETTNGLNPVNAQAAVSGHILFRALYDTLTINGADGQVVPNLLESFSSNDDFTEWTLTLPPGIVFHDGSPADAAALKRHFEEQQLGTLTGIAIGDWEIQEIQIVDDLSIKLVLGRPYSALPYFLSSHLGYFGAPSMHDLGAEGAARNPIGTGPFMLDEWIPNEVTRMVRNPNYWRTDAEGRSLPYLDAIEFRPIPDTDGRFNALRSGDLDATSVNTGLRVDEYNEQFNTFWQDEDYNETTYLLLNNSRAPFDNVEFRRALAQCFDVQTFNTIRWDGQAPVTGPFSPGTPGYLADSGHPTYDPAAGSAAIARLGITELELGTTNDPANLLNTELIAAMWGDCGLDVSITQVDQAELITNAVFGNFTAFLWRQHESYNLAVERVWWHSKFGLGIALNFGRINNPAIDAALDEALTTDSRDRHRELAEDINRAFADQVHYLWGYHSNWLFATHDHVHGVDNLTLRNGAEHEKVFSGRVFLTETWIEQ